MRIFPQQRKLMGSSAHINYGVRRCGLQAQVPEGSGGSGGGFRKVPVCAGAGSGGRFRKVPEGCTEGSGVLGAGSGGRFRRFPEGFGRCWRVPENSGSCLRGRRSSQSLLKDALRAESPSGRGSCLRGRRSSQSLHHHSSHLPLISPPFISYNTDLTMSHITHRPPHHHSSDTTHHTTLTSHLTTTHLAPLITHHSSHSTPLTLLLSPPLISYHSSHFSHHTTLFSHHHSSHTNLIISWKTQNFTCGGYPVLLLCFWREKVSGPGRRHTVPGQRKLKLNHAVVSFNVIVQARQDRETQSTLLEDACPLYAVDGLASGGYCSLWLTRCIPDARMFEAGARLTLTTADSVDGLPGPDECGYMPKAAKAFGLTSAKQLLRKTGYQLSPHLFAMTACLTPRVQRWAQKAKIWPGVACAAVFCTPPVPAFEKKTFVEPGGSGRFRKVPEGSGERTLRPIEHETVYAKYKSSTKEFNTSLVKVSVLRKLPSPS